MGTGKERLGIAVAELALFPLFQPAITGVSIMDDRGIMRAYCYGSDDVR